MLLSPDLVILCRGYIPVRISLHSGFCYLFFRLVGDFVISVLSTQIWKNVIIVGVIFFYWTHSSPTRFRRMWTPTVRCSSFQWRTRSSSYRLSIRGHKWYQTRSECWVLTLCLRTDFVFSSIFASATPSVVGQMRHLLAHSHVCLLTSCAVVHARDFFAPSMWSVIAGSRGWENAREWRRLQP